MASSPPIGMANTEYAAGGAYKLEQLLGEEIPNTWNVSHLKFYFS